MRELTKLRGVILNWRAVSGAAILVIVALILLYVSDKLKSQSPIWFGSVLPNFAAVVASSGVFALIYEVLIRRQQTEFVLEALDLRESLIRAGLDDISLDYLDLDYSARITKARHISLFVLYGQSWLNRYSSELGRHLEKEGHSLTLCVPAFDNPFFAPLADHFNYSQDELRRRIAESVSTCALPALKGRVARGSWVRIFMHRSHPAYSMYKFDGSLMVGTYYSSSSRRRAPMFEFMDAPGSVFSEFADDFRKVLEDESDLVFDNDQGVNRLLETLGDFTPEALRRVISTASTRQSPNPSPTADR